MPAASLVNGSAETERRLKRGYYFVARANADRDNMRCLLCGKPREQVKKLILGLHGGICVECIDLCNDIIRNEMFQEDDFGVLGGLPKPKEISRILGEYVVGQDRAK